MSKEPTRESFLLNASQLDLSKMSLHEEKLEELCLKINKLQRENTLRQKVIFSVFEFKIV